MNPPDNDIVLAAFISVNKQLVALGEKDRLRQELHERLQNSQIRTELENRVRQIIRESGGVDNVNLDTLVKRIRGSLPPPVQEVSGAIIGNIIEFTQTKANQQNSTAP
uniref:Uncharacterized protein n=1 Tax=Daphnia galeata TaxID=27404 RepID=A0A8J2WA01_9CRUS|nr:unnamed protein product [Daphnia galeata]